MFSRVFSRSSIQTILFGSKLQCNFCTKQTHHALSSDNLQRHHELYGQPTPETHPHLMKSGELVPGITQAEFKERRNELMQNLMVLIPQKHHLAVIPSATKMYMTEKIPYVFRQNSDFLYLTGCLEPDSVLVMFGDGPENYTSLLFLRKRDAHSELWDGPRTGVERAPVFFGVDKSFPLTELKPYLASHVKSHPSLTLWYDDLDPVNASVDKAMSSLLEDSSGETTCESPRVHIHKQRIIKSPAEQRLMQESCNIASAAITKAMYVSTPGITEHQLFATVDFESRIRGAEYLAYPPVVAAGNNGTIIHYINNTQQTQPGDMVLMDAGCEYHGYTSDITRTWPVDGKFTEPQRVLYEIILETQLELIQICQKQLPLDNLFHCMCRALGTKLKNAGVFSKSVTEDKLAKCVSDEYGRSHRKRSRKEDTDFVTLVAYDFCPHHVSHYLGMDVHDTALIPRNIPLKHGMVVTVEPGVYVSHNNNLARPEFRGLGIRIEDDILITDSGVVVLSSGVPKEIDEIEKIVSSTNKSIPVNV